MKFSLLQYLRRIPGYHGMRRGQKELLEIYENYLFSSRWRKRVTTHYGFKLLTSRSAGHAEMAAGTFEQEEIGLIKSHLTQADVFVDVGANIGLYVCLAALLGKHAVAFEPQKKNLELLSTNLSENDFRDVE